MINLRSVDLNLLTIFEAVYEEQSQVRASERLCMTQPAVSNALARLRYLVNDRLFEGRTKGLKPTPRADELYIQVHAALTIIRHELSDQSAFDPLTSFRTFSLSASFSGGVTFAPRLYACFQSQAPNAQLIFRTIDPAVQIPNLLRTHQLDLAIHPGHFDDPQLEQVVLIEDSLVIMVRSDHPRIKDEPTQEACLREKYVAAYRQLQNAHDVALNTFMTEIRERTVMEVANTLVVANTVRQTDLLAITNRQMALVCREGLGIDFYPLPVEQPMFRLYLVWHKSQTDDLGHSWLREQMKLLAVESPSPAKHPIPDRL
jgi:DNA-binding transcriptional LysR family regulator